jgi:SAM-dependent methyltransferase
MTDLLTPDRRAELVQAAREWGYFAGAIKSRRDLWHGRRILDVGMGAGPHSISFIEGGCAAYVGVDPLIGSEHVRDFRNLKDPSIPAYHAFPFSSDEIMNIMPDVHLYAGLLEDVAEQVTAHQVDIAMLAAVTEHLTDPEAVFRSIWQLLAPDGLLWLSHCNYYSWTGHHAPPRSVAGWDRTNPAHNAVVDWQHLEPESPHYRNPNFNRMRLGDFRELIENYFDIIEWNVSVEALERLTPELREKYRKYTLEELLGQNIYVTARRRATPAGKDFSDRVFHHPPEDYQWTKDYRAQPLRRFEVMNSVFLQPGNMVCSHSTNNFAGAKVLARMAVGDRIVLRKFVNTLDLTVAEVIVMPSGERRVRVVEQVPDSVLQGNYDQWSIIAHEWQASTVSADRTP